MAELFQPIIDFHIPNSYLTLFSQIWVNFCAILQQKMNRGFTVWFYVATVYLNNTVWHKLYHVYLTQLRIAEAYRQGNS